MKYYALHNPFAGNDESRARLKMLDSLYGKNIFYQDITKLENLSEFIASLEPDDVLILCGGDGTINRFVNSTEGIDFKNDILYFAIGTGNDFLRDVERTPDAKPFSIKEYIKDLPVVEVEGKRYRFLNNVGFGIDGYCCEVGDELKKTSTKPVNYTMIAIKGLLFNYKPTGATVVVDGTEYRYEKVWIAPTMKGRFYGGGMMAAPEQQRSAPSGVLSLMMFYGKGKIRTLSVFPSIFKGEHVKHKDMTAIHVGREISVTFDSPRTVQIDGETILGVKSYSAFAKA